MADDTQNPAGGAQQPQRGVQPPRPGDSVPEGGLDPSQVFAAPPQVSPPPTQQQSGQQQDDQAAPPSQDPGPPPPPPGVPATKEMGYDDEDIRILGEVGDYRFGSITAHLNNENIPLPSHPEAQFDEQAFLTLLRGSISLTRDEKWRIIQAIPKLSQFQIDELQKILGEEKRKFSELSPKHLIQLKKLEEKHAQDWKDLQSISVQEHAKQHEQQEADAIRKQLGI
ncbi:hypothetical protein GX553_03995 [Candidatus Peribacteria bacterium]|nr:hypothetical protein [Candidatus Peribacteria bacterium]